MPTQLVERVVFLQGDDAADIFRIMYPEGKSYGSPKTLKAAVDALKEFDNGEKVQWEELDTSGTTGIHRTKDHIVIWNYPLCWIAFYRRTTKRAQGIKRR